MNTLSVAADVASLLCLPATLAAIPGILVLFSDKMRAWLVRYPQTKFWILGVLAAILAIDICLRANLFPASWFIPATEQVYRRTFKDEHVPLDNKQFVECVFENVTFHWAGGDFFIHKSRIIGHYRLIAENDLIGRIFYVLNQFKAIGPNATPFLIPKDPK